MNVGYGPFVGQDVRARVCVRCRREYIGCGAGDGMCSNNCWVTSRGRQESQNATLTRAAPNMQDAHERRALGSHPVNRLLRDAGTEVAVERYRWESRETEELISRMQARSRGEVVRTPAPAPDCKTCRRALRDGKRRPATASQMAEIHRLVYEGGAAITRDRPYRAQGYYDAGEIARGAEGGILGVW